MTTGRKRDLERICLSALERAVEERAAYLAEACGGDEDLRREAESLLARDDAAASFLEQPGGAYAESLALSAVGPALVAGDYIGPYSIVSRLGSGGMGEVYRARDATLGREVAIKVLPPDLTSDPARVARLEREARLLASLNHPNIATIHGVERAGGALVLELVEGETLAERLKSTVGGSTAGTGLPLAAVLSIARQIADALEAAHEKGVVHRDLKPAYVMIRPDCVVKLLDFGLAKGVTGDAGPPEYPRGPVLTVDATRHGAILGTAAYMSPEQARGKPVDRRTDVWAFGCVLYEMLTGRRAFDGRTASDVVASVLEREPDFEALPAGTPDPIRRLLRRALTKDLRNRLRDVSDARLELVETLAATSDAHGRRLDTASPAPPLRATSAAATRSARSATSSRLALAIGVSGVAIALAIVWVGLRPPQPRIVSRFELVPPESAPLAAGVGLVGVAISHDGRRIAYPTNRGLAVRPLDELEVDVIEARTGGSPFFSSDGRWIGYLGDGLRKVPVNGGPSTRLATVGPGATATWGGDAVIFADAYGLFRVSAEGGASERLAAFPDTQQAAYPEILPDGSAVLFTVLSARTNTPHAVATAPESRIEALDLRTGAITVVVSGGGRPRYVPTGHLVYSAGDALMAVAFDADRLVTRGDPVQIADRGASSFAVSNEGTLIYVAGGRSNERRLVWVDRDGREEGLDAPPDDYIYPRLSPDGSRVAVDLIAQNRDVWIWDLGRKLLENFTLHPAEDAIPRWSPDGTQLLFASTRDGPVPNIFMQAADRSGTAERVIDSQRLQHPSGFAPDGRLLLAEQVPNHGLRDIMALSLDTGRVEPVVATDATEANPVVSPDGRWIAYDSNESGQFEVYVSPYPKTDGGRWRVSTSGGRQALWSRNGRELYYRDYGGAVIAVPVPAGTRFSPGPPVTILPAATVYAGGGAALSSRTYDLSVDGSRFLMVKIEAAGSRPSVVVVQNWFEELMARVPVR